MNEMKGSIGPLADSNNQFEKLKLAELDQQMKELENTEWIRDDDPRSKTAKDILWERANLEKERGTDFV